MLRTVDEGLVREADEEVTNAVLVGEIIRRQLHVRVRGHLRLPGARHGGEHFLLADDPAVDLACLVRCHFRQFLFHGGHEDLVDNACHDDEDQQNRRADQGDHSCFQIHDGDSFLYLTL